MCITYQLFFFLFTCPSSSQHWVYNFNEPLSLVFIHSYPYAQLSPLVNFSYSYDPIFQYIFNILSSVFIFVSDPSALLLRFVLFSFLHLLYLHAAPQSLCCFNSSNFIRVTYSEASPDCLISNMISHFFSCKTSSLLILLYLCVCQGRTNFLICILLLVGILISML